ncbi:hypothetical protein [Cognatishimia sp.]|uniref:hypothetical protein n=1 Tax=Cognatishimia sp. TaxID=2211648 RepID=UPI003519CEA7
MMRSVFSKVFSSLAVLSCATPIAADTSGPIAQILCEPQEIMRRRLETYHQAQRSWAGLRGPDSVMELWEDAGGDWTLVIVYSDGNRCIVAMGEDLMPFAAMSHS